MTKQRFDSPAKQSRIGWMDIGVALIIIAGAVYTFTRGAVDTEQLVLQGFLAVCGVGMLAQGIVRLVNARRG
ncbi:hypothetical protein [Kutzneria sp. NPDC052558]|uniref:hypothetical protein n=1 Tax=Kutzneria sp. NPDC052558 TaxID=3364121 RepID=UPI0037C834BC